tara:strand:- start:40 stop:270 length:231 start_codon:yes stop_codon:yes gene_type:complete
MKKKCRVCKYKTEDYKKINKTKIYLCNTGCEINYVVKRFLHKNYNYDSNQGNLSFHCGYGKGRGSLNLKGWLEHNN